MAHLKEKIEKFYERERRRISTIKKSENILATKAKKAAEETSIEFNKGFDTIKKKLILLSKEIKSHIKKKDATERSNNHELKEFSPYNVSKGNSIIPLDVSKITSFDTDKEYKFKQNVILDKIS